MIPEPPLPQWQQDLRQAYTRPAELLAFLGLPPDHRPPNDAALDFPIRVPLAYARRMRHGDPADPLLRQVWPDPDEARAVAGYGLDAVGDLSRLRAGGVVHKYHGRALVITTGACAVHCRYCFRRHFPYGEALAARDHWREALDTIAADTTLREIILSGGDPLSLPDRKLAEFADALDALPHLQRLRIHTRQPIVLPSRVDEALLAWLARGRLKRCVVLHVNHAQEIDQDVAAALGRLHSAGLPLLNQAVLLAGVNDTTDAQIRLSERLFECGVLPYYLHMLDHVSGSAHFEVPESHAASLMREMHEKLPGYLVPRLVRETAGMPAKTPVAW